MYTIARVLTDTPLICNNEVGSICYSNSIYNMPLLIIFTVYLTSKLDGTRADRQYTAVVEDDVNCRAGRCRRGCDNLSGTIHCPGHGRRAIHDTNLQLGARRLRKI